MTFPIGDHSEPSLYLSVYLLQTAALHLFIVTFQSEHLISNGFRDIQSRMWRSGWHDLDKTSKRRSR